MILAAPLVIPFAEAVGISIATLGMAKAADMVNDYIQENPEQSAMILKTLVPNLGIGEIFMKKGKDEEVEEEVSVEDIDPKDLTKEEKAKMMKELAKSGASREKMIKGYEEIIQPGEDRTLVDAEERYDEGGVEDAPKPKFDYKKFFRNRRADGGSIGIEVLFEEKKPRKNFFMGGSPLEGQALSIYDSMKAYNFSDQEIANALSAQGLYTSGSTPDTPDTTPGGNTLGYQAGGGGGGGGGGITTLDPLTRTPMNPNSFLGKTFSKIGDFAGSMMDKFSGTKVGEGITAGTTKFKNFAITPMMALMQKRNPLNPDAMNYNPNLEKQMNFLEGRTGTKISGTYKDPYNKQLGFTDDLTGQPMIGRDSNSGLAKYGPGSVLSGQNVVSGFGTNDYAVQLNNYISKMMGYKNRTAFQNKKLEAAREEARKEFEREKAANQAFQDAMANQQSFYASLNDGTGATSTSKSRSEAGGGAAANAGAAGSGWENSPFADGGLATMFKEKR